MELLFILLILFIGVCFYIAKYNLKRNELNKRLDNLLIIAFNNPEFEDLGYIKKMSNPETDSLLKTRYELYCIMVFNYIELIYTWGYHKEFSNVIKEYISVHYLWFLNNADNESYSRELHMAVHNYVSEKK